MSAHIGDPDGPEADEAYTWFGAHYEVWAGDGDTMRLQLRTNSKAKAQRAYQSASVVYPRARLERHVAHVRIAEESGEQQ